MCFFFFRGEAGEEGGGGPVIPLQLCEGQLVPATTDTAVHDSVRI